MLSQLNGLSIQEKLAMLQFVKDVLFFSELLK